MNVMLLGMESCGKTALVRSLADGTGESARFRGSTLACETYEKDGITFIDSPGIFRSLDSVTSRIALATLESEEWVMLVLNARHLDRQLPELLPLLTDKKGVVALTHWDLTSAHPQAEATLAALKNELGVPVIPLDARNPSAAARRALNIAMCQPAGFPESTPPFPALYNEKMRNIFSSPVLGPLMALLLLFAPACLAVTGANAFANALYTPLYRLLDPVLAWVELQHPGLNAVLAGDYGFLAMFPFLLLYALPTVIIFSLFLSLLKTSGLIDRLTVALEGVLRPFGLNGRDLVRVVMGFGCNVPAVINTRACSGCSRGATVHAISFGSACSYQLPASLAVFSAAGMTELAPLFLFWLGITTLVYVRLTTPKAYRNRLNVLKLAIDDPIQCPSLRRVWQEIWQTLRQFLQLSLPVFFVICFMATLMQVTGLFKLLGRVAEPFMALFNLPGEAAAAVTLGSIRKDGLAIALLDSDWETLKVPLETPVQVLTAVFLSGVLLPCLVTFWTIAREFNLKYALRLAARQIAGAVGFSLLLAWGGLLIF